MSHPKRDATAADLLPDHEGAYRRGVAQALEFAADLLDDCRDKQEAHFAIHHARMLAQRLRCTRSDQGHGALLDFIGARVRPVRKGGSPK